MVNLVDVTLRLPVTQQMLSHLMVGLVVNLKKRSLDPFGTFDERNFCANKYLSVDLTVTAQVHMRVTLVSITFEITVLTAHPWLFQPWFNF